MNLAKSLDYFDPSVVKDRIHIIGCGSVGGFVAELFTRFGLTRFALYDFDTVEDKNIANQIFTTEHLGKNKCDAVFSIMKAVNPDITDKTGIIDNVKIYREGYSDQPLDGYVFLCVDNIELRKQIVKKNVYNQNIKAMFDFRTRLTDSQHYAADWLDDDSIDNFYNSMNFSADEASQETEVSACGVSLCVAPTVRMIAEAGVMNFIRFVRTGKLKYTVLIDIENLTIDAFE